MNIKARIPYQQGGFIPCTIIDTFYHNAQLWCVFVYQSGTISARPAEEFRVTDPEILPTP